MHQLSRIGFEQKATKGTKRGDRTTKYTKHTKHTKARVNELAPAFGVRELAPAFRLAHDWAVKKRRRLFLIVTGVGVLVGVLALIFQPEREPEYGGKRLSEWVDIYSDGARQRNEWVQAAQAIQRIGTNAVPYLVKCLVYEIPPPWKRSLLAPVDPILVRVKPSWASASLARSSERVARGML